MAQDKLTLYNLALTRVNEPQITDLDEDSRESRILNLAYDNVRTRVLRAAFWPSASAYHRLVLRSFGTVPDFLHAYTLPPGFLAVQRLQSGMAHRLGSHEGTGETVLFTDDREPGLHYTLDQNDVSRWDPGLFTAIAASLAASIAPGLTGKQELARFLNAEAAVEIARASHTVEDALVAGSSSRNPSASWIDARGGANLNRRDELAESFRNRD